MQCLILAAQPRVKGCNQRKGAGGAANVGARAHVPQTADRAEGVEAEGPVDGSTEQNAGGCQKGAMKELVRLAFRSRSASQMLFLFLFHRLGL
jgi:hypothetical protein